MSTILSVICAFLIFGAVITIHEYGHYRVAKWCGIKVYEFAIGMGPVIYRKKGRETDFTLRALPLGGFCRMGEDEEAQDEDINAFRNKPVWARILTIMAGPVMNFVLGFVLAAVILLIDGKYVSTVIAQVEEGSSSALSGLTVGDEITHVNGMKCFTAKDIVYALSTDEDGVLDFTVKRDGEKLAINGVHFDISEDENGQRTLRYDFKVEARKLTPAQFLPQTCRKFLYYSRLIYLSLYDLVRGKYGLNSLQGPVGIVSVISQTARETNFDPSYLLDLAMLISVNLGIMNLLPLPALDGGRLVFLFIEAFRRKPVPAEAEGMVHFAGFALLMIVMLIATFNDVKAIFIK
ncbi:MAG: RIP metalloprotease RseP [Oscillospiraceae bacterium]|nr:RIP metalloprotease RseP [Oscillospiraceae bacterium]